MFQVPCANLELVFIYAKTVEIPGEVTPLLSETLDDLMQVVSIQLDKVIAPVLVHVRISLAILAILLVDA